MGLDQQMRKKREAEFLFNSSCNRSHLQRVSNRQGWSAVCGWDSIILPWAPPLCQHSDASTIRCSKPMRRPVPCEESCCLIQPGCTDTPDWAHPKQCLRIEKIRPILWRGWWWWLWKLAVDEWFTFFCALNCKAVVENNNKNECVTRGSCKSNCWSFTQGDSVWRVIVSQKLSFWLYISGIEIKCKSLGNMFA